MPHEITDTPERHWQVLEEADLLSALPWLHITRQHVRLPNQVEIPDFYQIQMPVFVTIFAVTFDLQVIMVEQYRHGPRRVTLELPSGNIEGEISSASALAAAQRELREETGAEANQWVSLGHFYIDSNRGCGATYAFLATEAALVAKATPESTEIIQTRVLPLTLVRDLWRSNQVDSIVSSAIIGLALARLQDMEGNA